MREAVILYSYWRSSTAYRVRIALNLKGIGYELAPVDLVAGEQQSPGYSKLNPGQSVPSLVLSDGTVLTQSMAILEWLEERYRDPPLLPDGANERARVRAAALGIATDIHPVNNLRVTNRLKSLGHSQEETVAWMNEWMGRGLAAFQALIEPDAPYCFGDNPGMADICLVPQMSNAHRWGCDLSSLDRLCKVEARCLALPAFEKARPENQPDAK